MKMYHISLIFRLSNGSYVGMISEINNGIVDSSVAPITMTVDRNHFVEPTIGIFKESIEVFIKTPTKRNTSLKYFILGRSI